MATPHRITIFGYD